LPTRTPVPLPTWTSLAKHPSKSAQDAKKQRPAAVATAQGTTPVRSQAVVPAANIGDGAGGDWAGPARVATFAALLAGFVLVAGHRLRLSLRRRAYPPRHAAQTVRHGGLMPQRGQRRRARSDDEWRF